MSILKCPECGNDVSDKAIACPHCGLPSNCEPAELKSNHRPFPISAFIFMFFCFIFGILIANGNITFHKTGARNNTPASIKSNDNIMSKTSAADENTRELTIDIGDTIKTTDAEITIKKIEFSYDVLPDDTSGLYTHYAADKGNVYIHIDTDVKNLAKQNLDCDSIMTISADYNDGYIYSGQAVPEDSSTGFSYANITSISPLKTLGVRYLISCPEEVVESPNDLYISLKIHGSKDVYKYVIR